MLGRREQRHFERDERRRCGRRVAAATIGCRSHGAGGCGFEGALHVECAGSNFTGTSRATYHSCCTLRSRMLHATPASSNNVPSRQERASRARNDVGVTPYSTWKEREKYDTLLNPTA